MKVTLNCATWHLLAVLPLLSGCGSASGPSIAPVRGVVTLDGKPVSGAIVEFQPEAGRPSVSVTRPDGAYEMQYAVKVPGAVLGPHTVTIRNPAVQSRGENEETTPSMTLPLPDRFHSESEMEVEVKPNSNVFNFELVSR
ncbi:carboxypeptidase regulatory-like domain-containing protein [Planctomicrobium sp. SH661]|uniref:carboxypeptidase regulatory-like domain-containing protein n=1 Tax=Planctomicrobium sp. SH661 TaxID=3448124 RepID=UPI003F5AEA9B